MEKVEWLVSVIIPTFKGTDSIIRAVSSVLNQTYSCVEVIVVDDNGRGTNEQVETERLLEKLIHSGKIYYIVHEVSKKGSAARNTGFKVSHGDFISFLDDDDSFEAKNIEKHVESLTKHSEDYGFSYCDFKVIREGYSEESIKSTFEGDFLFDFLMGRVRVGSSLLCYRRHVFEELNGFDESFKRHQDWELICRTLYKWKGAKTGYEGVNKYILSRNTPKEPKISEEYRLYYLNKMNPIINSLGKQKARQIMQSNYFEISKDYFKAKKIVGGIRWIMKTHRPIYYSFKICLAAIKQRKKKNDIR